MLKWVSVFPPKGLLMTTAVASSFLLTSGAYGQIAPSHVTPQNVAPPPNVENVEIELPSTVQVVAPPGSEALSVKIGRIAIEGNSANFAVESAKIVQSLEGRTVTVAQLYEAASAIEALYARAGYVLTRATVPAQKLTNGSDFRIVIVEGFIEAVDVSGVPAALRKPAQRRTARLIGRKGMTLKEIERHVLLAGRVPGMRLESTLVPGNEPGGVKLVLNARYKPVDVAISTDNRLSPLYRKWNFDAQLALNSVLGQGEQIYGVASVTSDFKLFSGRPHRRIAGFGVVVPLGGNGLTINPEYVHSFTNPRTPAGGLRVSGRYDRLALRLNYPLVMNRTQTFDVNGGFEMVKERQHALDFGQRLSEDRVRFFALGFDWMQALTPRTTLGAGLTFSQGAKLFHARDRSDAQRSGTPLSRQYARPDFTKLSGTLRLGQRIAKHYDFSFGLNAQASLSHALPASVQASLDGVYGLSSFPMGLLNADSALTGRAEMARTFTWGGGTHLSSLTPYVFGAYGLGRIYRPTLVERRHIHGSSFGVGGRATLFDHISTKLELGRNRANAVRHRDTRLTFGVTVRF